MGKLAEDGSVTWQTEYDDWLYQEYHSDDPNVDVAGTSNYFPTVCLSGLNDGYCVTYYGPAVEWWMFKIYDASANFVTDANLVYMSEDGNYSADGSDYYEENDINGYYYDGCYFYNRGSKMVWTCGGNYILVDVLNPSPLAIYDYISLAEDDLWIVRKGEQYGYINPDGEELAVYDSAASFYNGYGMIVEDGIASMVDTDLNVVWELGEADRVSNYGELYGVINGDNVTLYRLAD